VGLTGDKLTNMKTQEELWAQYERLKAAELYEEAGKVLDLIDPISDEEWFRIVSEAPEVDETIPQFISERFLALDARLAKRRTRRVG